jgi:uncharacterized DUF497 family protein
MQFEWDSAKAGSNVAKHGVPFPYATRVFLDPLRVESEVARGEEVRVFTLGMVEGRVLVVVHTRRGRVTRIISARKANRREQEKYHAFHT